LATNCLWPDHLSRLSPLWFLSSENGYGPNLGGNVGFQPALAPPRWRRSEPECRGRRYAKIRTALGKPSPYNVCRYRRIRVVSLIR